MNNLQNWHECQSLLQGGAKETIEAMSQTEALEVIKAFYPDQTDYAVDVLTKDSWLSAKGIVEYLLNKYPELKADVIEWWTKVEKKAADKWMKETGQELF